MNLSEARTQWAADRALLAAKGLIVPGVTRYRTEAEKFDIQIAMDAQPQLVTDPSAAIPVILTTTIDPDVVRVVFQPLAMAEIWGERKAGSWTDMTRIFPVVEATGEVSSYGDFNNNGRAGINLNWPEFQSYLFQTTVSYGELELERAGLAKINYVSELDISAAYQLNQYQNLTYAFGIAGLQNYGAVNNPFLSAFLTASTKVAGGTTWFANGVPNATANEVYNDILALVQRLVAQCGGALDMNSAMTLVMSPQSQVGLKFANEFGVYVEDLLKKGFPKMTVKVAPQYGVQSTTNVQGFSTSGNIMQLIATELQGQSVGYAAFNEKMRAHKIVPEMSAWKQKKTSGSWGTIIRMPVAIVGMVGI